MIVAVTGGSGFLGGRIVRELLERDAGFPVDSVRVVDRRASDIDDPRVQCCEGDICDEVVLVDAFDGVDLVIHTAAIVDWGRLDDDVIRRTNVEGTAAVLRAAEICGVGNVVYTSTMDVSWEGKAIAGADETLPHTEVFSNTYCATKAAAERLVVAQGQRAAARGEGPRTVVVRPLGIFGEADPYHCSQVLIAAQSGKLTSRMGDGSAKFSHVYVGNCAWGHVCAARELVRRGDELSGRVYLIGDDNPPENFFDFMERFISAMGYAFPSKSKTVPYGVAMVLAGVSQAFSRLVRPIWRVEPILTADSVRMLCVDFWFSDQRAREELGYRPLYSPDEAMERTVAWFRDKGPIPPPSK